MKTRLLHLTVLAGFALAQPLYDVLRRSGEFFVAHRTDAGDILLLAFWLSVAAPLLIGVLLWGVTRVSGRAGTVLTIALVGLFVALIALPPVCRRATSGSTEAFVISALHGLAAAVLYWQVAPARQFLTLLSPAAAVFPMVFLLHPAMRPFVQMRDSIGQSDVSVTGDTPVVFVVFDQLPLTALLDAAGEAIDARRFPGFASLAADSIWFRNATTVADFTAQAVPSLLSGRHPDSKSLPIVADHPNNVFTLLGGEYKVKALEPVTDLCPDRICVEAREPRWARQAGMLADLSVIYAHIVLPRSLGAALPSVTDDWRDFIRGQAWQERWLSARDDDRRIPIRRFIDGISERDPQPTLYFAHVLLPHEPYIYLPDGRQFTAAFESIGLDAAGNWPDDPWYALQAQSRELLQVGFVDSLVSRLVARLKRVGLYDRALIVITSDHGVSFTPGQPMKGLQAATAAEIAAVPLLIKPPQHQRAEVSDRNVQSIDVIPTLADLLHVRLPFATDGVSAVGADPARPVKRVSYFAATQVMELPASLRDRVVEVARRTAGLFAPPGPSDVWAPGAPPFRALLNHPVAELTLRQPSALSLELMEPWRFSRADPEDDFIPARVAGRIRGEAPHDAVPLAIAINGVVRATTKTVAEPLPAAGAWAAIVDPRVFRPGVNVVDVYEIATDHAEVVLRPALHSSARPPHLNLILGEASGWGVHVRGLHAREPLGDRVFRWTDGDAEVILPGEDYQDATVRLALAPMTSPGLPLAIAVNGCTVFKGVLGGGEWDQSFSLRGCPAELLQSPEVRIRITSGRSTPSARESRVLGVPIVALEFTAD
jgi:Sulfatase